jgi:16S rRNA C967 or C1407 C5-methylase (RsmB/RsmF family)
MLYKNFLFGKISATRSLSIHTSWSRDAIVLLMCEQFVCWRYMCGPADSWENSRPQRSPRLGMKVCQTLKVHRQNSCSQRLLIEQGQAKEEEEDKEKEKEKNFCLNHIPLPLDDNQILLDSCFTRPIPQDTGEGVDVPPPSKLSAKMPALTKAQQKQAQATEDSFNRTYAVQYGDERWQNSLRPALLVPTRYAVLVNRYEADSIPTTFTENDVKDLQLICFPSGAAAEARDEGQERLIAYQRTSTTEMSESSISEAPFPPPQAVSTSTLRLMTHWNLDAASLLVADLLDPQPGDKILDLCAAPGGKSLALAQLLRPYGFDPAAPTLGGGCLHSNEIDSARNKRLASNLQSYLPAPFFKTGEVKVLRLDGTEQTAAQMLPLGPGGYDKVLLDAPCSSERHVLHAHHKARQGGRVADEMVSWRSGQSKKTAKIQAAILMTALRAVKVGGRVLYATCSLSNEENDAVIEKGKELVSKERKKYGIRWDMAVRSGELAGKGVEQWAENTQYGWIVLPDHPSGGRWGPLFFAILEKVAA